VARSDGDTAEKQPITIKKYANRRLYNTATSSYVTLDHLCQMVKDGVEFSVFDAKTGEDITRPVLTQIIVEEEAKGENLLPISFLRQLISFYGHGMQWMVPSYLDHMMHSLAANQDRIAQTMQKTMGAGFPFASLEEMSKNSMEMFERTMKMFSPFPEGAEPEDPKALEADRPTGDQSQNLETLKKQMDRLQAQLDALSKINSGSK
jgi:polyhydroxyalkanoate synthesis repressor PhaR